MARRPPEFDIRLNDVMVFLSVREHGSVTAAARAFSSTPSHVSKAIDRLERQLGTRLLAKSGRGVTLTPAAMRLLPLLTSAADALRRARKRVDSPRDITVASPSYLLWAFVPALAEAIDSMRFRALQLAPPGILAAMGTGQFEVALNTGEARLPPSWVAEPLGELPAALFASPALAKQLGRPTLETLRRVPFITPVSFKGGQWEPIDDGCPLPVGERLNGHEAPAIGLALEIASTVPQLTFGPRIAARQHLKMRRLVEVPVPGWKVSSPMYLAVEMDRVTARELQLLKQVALGLLD
ncbi:MAG: LysR family transcriptional regulator [Archangiaceae bacterium]|nr:LysR family transcriptional regulator [Archangiaceae bacterium]